MATRVQALEQKVDSAVPCKIYLIGRSPHPTSDEAAEASKRDNPDIQDDEFIVMVGLLALKDLWSD